LDFGNIKSQGDNNYTYWVLSDLSLRRDTGCILTIQNSVDYFLMKGTLTPPNDPVQLMPSENWIGYILKDSYNPLVVLSPVLDQISRIEAQK